MPKTLTLRISVLTVSIFAATVLAIGVAGYIIGWILTKWPSSPITIADGTMDVRTYNKNVLRPAGVMIILGGHVSTVTFGADVRNVNSSWTIQSSDGKAMVSDMVTALGDIITASGPYKKDLDDDQVNGPGASFDVTFSPPKFNGVTVSGCNNPCKVTIGY